MSNKKKVTTITPVELTTKTTTEPVISTPKIRVINQVKDESIVEPEETKTIKLAESKSEVVVPVVEKKTEVVSSSVTFIRSYISNYLDYVNGPGIKNAKESITRFARIVTYVFSHQDDDVLDEVFNFFKQNRKSILSPDVALQGIYYLSANQQEKIQQFYTLFEHIATARKAKKLDLDYASSVLGTGNIISYVARRMM